MRPTQLVIVRHGETEWSESQRHTGRTDVALTAEGEAQARAMADGLPLDDVAAVWSSPLVRARETARLAGLQVDVIDPDLAEWDYGVVEGRTTSEIRAEGDPSWTVWDGPVDDGETVESVGTRVDRVLERTREVDGTVVLVGHAHLLRILSARWLGLPAVTGRHLTLDAGGWALLGWERETPVIERWNPPPT